MPRRRIPPKKPLLPDTRYGSTVITKFIKRMMLNGKRSIATRVVYDAFAMLEEKTSDVKPRELFLAAIENVKPTIEVKSRRVGGSTYQVPVEIGETRREALAMRWIISAAKNRNGKSMAHKLSAELMDAYSNTGNAFKKKEDTHRMAEANKAFAHYRW